MGKMVQFSTVEAVLKAYVDQDIPCFAIFHDKQLLFKWCEADIAEGADYLSKVLDSLKATGNYGVYTFCVYEDLNGKLKSVTPYDASFNFQLNANSSPRLGSVERGSSDYTDLAVENAILKLKLAQLEADDDDDDVKEDPIMGAIDKLMAVPGVEGLIGAIAERGADFIRNIGTKKEGFQFNNSDEQPQFYDKDGQPIKMRRIQGIGVAAGEKAKRIDEAICYLDANLSDLTELLEKLVVLHKKKPFQFKLFLAGLRGMNI